MRSRTGSLQGRSLSGHPCPEAGFAPSCGIRGKSENTVHCRHQQRRFGPWIGVGPSLRSSHCGRGDKLWLSRPIQGPLSLGRWHPKTAENHRTRQGYGDVPNRTPCSCAGGLLYGLVNKVVPLKDLQDTAQRLADIISAGAPIAVQYTKEAVHKGLDMALTQGLHLEADLSFILQSTKDRQKAIQSFLNKEKPSFTGE